MSELKLYVWEGFYPSYSGGLAIAVAESEEEARAMIIKNMHIEEEEGPDWTEELGFNKMDWGKLTVTAVTEKVTYGVFGGE